MFRKRLRPSSEAGVSAPITSAYDGRRIGPIRSGSFNNMNAALWVFAEHIEYVAGFRPKRLELTEVAEVEAKHLLVGGRLVFRRLSSKSVVECDFRTKKHLWRTLSILRTYEFPLSEQAQAIHHE